MFTANGDQQVHARDNAFNTDAMLASGSLSPTVDYDFIEMLPAALPLIINYRTGGGGGAIVRQLTLTYTGADLSTVNRTI